MIASHTKSAPRKQSCGCAGGTGCDCNSAISTPRCDTGFSRPNFFAGQLLTDEDLRAGLAYVIEKNRLHNRHFLGDGVVCGLEVRHHPCPDEQRKVIIKPGHALDCCGNDVVVPCEEELDVLTMVQELRTKLRGGYDCGDPCAESPKLFSVPLGPENELDSRRISESLRKSFADNRQTLPEAAAVTVLVAGREWRIDGVIQYHLRKDANALNVFRTGDEQKAVYNLYIRYAETGFDLVAPYQVDEDCNSACKPSRIRESFRFELSCDEPPPEVDLHDRLSDCNDAVPNYSKRQAETLHGSRVLETAEQVLIQFVEIGTSLIGADASAAAKRKELHDAITNPTFPTLGPRPSVQEQVEAATAIHRFITLAIRAFYEPIRSFAAALVNPTKALLPTIDGILAILPNVDPDTRTDQFKFPVDNTVVDLLRSRTAALRVALDNGNPGVTFDDKAQIVGELVTLNIVNDAIKSLDKIDVQFKQLVRAGAVVVDRELKQLMSTVQLRLFYDMSDQLKTPELLQVVKRQVAVVSRVVAEISSSCLCEIVLPPCPSCNDPRVLIASVTVEACNVVDICNVKRKMVLTGPSLNYWFAGFGIPERIRASCCPSPDDIARAKLDEIDRLRRQTENWRAAVAPPDPQKRPFAPNLQDRVNNPDQWQRLQGSEIGKLAQSAIESAGFELGRELRDGEVPSPQAINVLLSKLAARPATDIRGILDRTGDAKPAAEVERELRGEIEKVAAKLEPQIAQAMSTSSQAKTIADNAAGVAGAFQGRLAFIEGEVGTGAISRIDKLETEVLPAGQSRLTALEAEVGTPGASRIDDHESRIATLETDVGPMKVRVSALDAEVFPSGASRLDDLETQTSNNKSAISTEKGRITALKNRYDAHSTHPPPS